MKIFAVILVLASTLMTAYMIILNENRHVRDLKSAIDVMIDIKNFAIQYLLPFRDIIETYVADKNIESVDYIEIFLTDSVFPPPEAWKNAISESNAALTNREKEQLILFGESLCHCSREQICEYSEKYINELSEMYVLLNETKEKKIKTVSALTLSAGIMVILMLV